jgi:hypothetical protein
MEKFVVNLYSKLLDPDEKCFAEIVTLVLKKVKVAGGVLWHFSHLGFLYPDPEGVPSFISRGAARRTTAAPQLAKVGTMNGNFACVILLAIQ